MLQKRPAQFPVGEGITTNLEDPIYDFRGSVQGEVLTVTAEEKAHILSKKMAASALEGWVLDGEMPVRLVVLDPPYRSDSAVLFQRNELGFTRLRGKDTNIIFSFGKNPDISLETLPKEESVA